MQQVIWWIRISKLRTTQINNENFLCNSVSLEKKRINWIITKFVSSMSFDEAHLFYMYVIFRLQTLECHHSVTLGVRLRSRLILNQDIRTLLSSVRTWIKRWLLTPSTSQMWHQVRERNQAFKRFKAHYLNRYALYVK